jgi:hypothetical protein
MAVINNRCKGQIIEEEEEEEEYFIANFGPTRGKQEYI